MDHRRRDRHACRARVGEEVLYCTETDSTGFKWDKGSSEGKRQSFVPFRFTVKIISETTRVITPTTGATAGNTRRYTCHQPWSTPKMRKQIVCDDGFGNVPWIFYDNTFMAAYLSGPPIGADDPNAWIAYGTCAKY